MRSTKLSRRSMLAAAAAGSMLIATIAAESADDLKPPTGYRTWFHVNTMIVDKASPLFADLGGMHNVYANATAVAALKKGFQFWAEGDANKPQVTDAAKQCFACHEPKKDQDYVYSTYIP